MCSVEMIKFSILLKQVPVSLAKSESSSAKMDELFPKALNGFILVLSSDGNMIYLSENVSDYLGVSQVCLITWASY
jgi:hypothetical protein